MISEEEIRKHIYYTGWKTPTKYAYQLISPCICMKGEDRDGKTITGGLYSYLKIDLEATEDLKKAKEKKAFSLLIRMVQDAFEKSIIRLPSDEYFDIMDWTLVESLGDYPGDKIIPVTNLRLA